MILTGNNFKIFYVIIFTLFLYNIALYSWNQIEHADNDKRLFEICTFSVPFKIVMPFHINQTEKLIDNIKSWSQFKPCVEKNINVELVFFYGHSLESFAEKEAFINEISKHVDRFCFQRIHFVEFRFKSKGDDSHINGARMMFQHMLFMQDDAFKNTDFVFYMEPDTYPIRSSWLNAVQNNIGDGNFWIKGAIFRGNSKIIINENSFYFHINGNATYKISDENYIKFWQFVFKNYGDRSRGYDVSYYDYFFHKNFHSSNRSFLYKFKYTDMIQNLVSSKYSKQYVSIQHKNTYFVHGGSPSA